jgi:hypothetical protein
MEGLHSIGVPELFAMLVIVLIGAGWRQLRR